MTGHILAAQVVLNRNGYLPSSGKGGGA